MPITPHMHDVLCGRGKGSYRHQGNVVYRELVNLYKLEYIASKKHEKKKISERIVNAIQTQDPPGKFIEFNAKLGCWNLVADKRAIEKTSQTLREGHDNMLPPQQKQKIVMSNSIRKQISCSKSSESTTAYFRNQINTEHSIKKPNNSHAVPSSMKYPLNKLSSPEQTISSESKSSFLNLSFYNNLILANLQKDYSSHESQVSFPESEICSVYQQQFHEEIIRNDSYGVMSNDNDNMQTDDDDDIDDDILMTIMDLDPDVSSSVTSSITTNASSSTSITSHRNSGMMFSSQFRRRSYSNAAA